MTGFWLKAPLSFTNTLIPTTFDLCLLFASRCCTWCGSESVPPLTCTRLGTRNSFVAGCQPLATSVGQACGGKHGGATCLGMLTSCKCRQPCTARSCSSSSTPALQHSHCLLIVTSVLAALNLACLTLCAPSYPYTSVFTDTTTHVQVTGVAVVVLQASATLHALHCKPC